MGDDYAWMNHTRREYFHEWRWSGSGILTAGLAWLMSSFSEHRWKPEDRIALVVIDYDRDWEREVIEPLIDPEGYTDEERWTDLGDILNTVAEEFEWSLPGSEPGGPYAGRKMFFVDDPPDPPEKP